MKKMVLSFLSVVCAVLLCLAFAGCGENAESVSGNTYVYESCTVSGPAFEQNPALKEEIEKSRSDFSFRFNEDGTYEELVDGEVIVGGKWTQDGSKGTLTQTFRSADRIPLDEDEQVTIEFKVSGDKIEVTDTLEGTVTITIILKKQPKS